MGSVLAVFSAVSQGFMDFETGRLSKSYPVILATFAEATRSVVVFCILRLFIKSHAAFDISSIEDGIAMGLFLALGNFLTFKALSTGPMGLVSAAGGLELVPPIIFDSSIGKAPSIFQLAGMLLIFFGLFVASRSPRGGNRFSTVTLAIAIAGAAVFGCADIVFSIGDHGDVVDLLIVAQLTKVFVFFFAIVALRIKVSMISHRSWKLFSIIGVFNGVLWMTFSRAIDMGSIDVATAILSTSPVITALLAYQVLKENLRRIQLIGMLVSIAGTMMLI